MNALSARDVTALVLMVLMVLTATAALGQRTPGEVQAAQQRFTASASGWSKSASRLTGLADSEKDMLSDIRYVYELSPLPKVKSLRRFGERRVVVSDGWMSLTEDLVRADVVSAAGIATGKGSDCFSDFSRTALTAARDNLRRAADGAGNALKTVPRLATFINSDDPGGCRGLKKSDLTGPKIEEAVANGVDAALVWLLARQTALLIEPQVSNPMQKAPEPLIAPAVSSASAPPVERPIEKASAPPVKPMCAHAAASPPPATASSSPRQSLHVINNCRAQWADQRAIDRAAALCIDLLPGHAGVLSHLVLFGNAGDGPGSDGCLLPKERAEAFFKEMAATHPDLKAVEQRAAKAWPVDRPYRR